MKKPTPPPAMPVLTFEHEVVSDPVPLKPEEDAFNHWMEADAVGELDDEDESD